MSLDSVYEELVKNPQCRKVSVVIKNRLYFTTLKKNIPEDTDDVKFFKMDTEKTISLATIARFLKDVDSKMSTLEHSSKTIVFCAFGSEKARRDAAVCIGVYSLVNLKMNIMEVTENVMGHSSILNTDYFLNAIYKIIRLELFDFQTFNEDVFEDMSKINLSWIVPHKILRFSGPPQKDTSSFPPKKYLRYFHYAKVRTIIRLNHMKFDANPFVDEGLYHYDLILDSSSPSQSVLTAFMDICENSPGVIVVHCRQMFGCSGCLVSAYLVKHYHLTSEEAVAWVKLCTPDCITESQRKWLRDREEALWEAASSSERLFKQLS